MATDSQLFYEENGRVASVFWEWRHKVILLCASALGGVVAIASWLYERQLPWALPTPFVFGGATFFICWRLDHRIAKVLEQCYERGEQLETLAEGAHSGLQGKIGVYGSFHKRSTGVFRADNPLKGSFTRLLRWTYISLMVVMFALAAVTAGLARWDSQWLRTHHPPARSSAVDAGVQVAVAATGR